MLCAFGGLGCRSLRPYIDPKEPIFLGFRIMISLYESLRQVIWG